MVFPRLASIVSLHGEVIRFYVVAHSRRAFRSCMDRLETKPCLRRAAEPESSPLDGVPIRIFFLSFFTDVTESTSVYTYHATNHTTNRRRFTPHSYRVDKTHTSPSDKKRI